MPGLRKNGRMMAQFSALLLFLLLSLILIGCNTAPASKNEEQKKVVQETVPLQGKIVIRWQNIPGYDSYGFNIQRSEAREGPFTKLNKDIILVSSKSKQDAEYMFVDQPLEIGKIYY